MALWGMVIDLDRCTGCQACVMACKAENNVPAVGADEAKRGRVISWMQALTETDEEHHASKTRFIPRPCLQCDDPPCTKVCPVYATYRNPEGIVAQIYARCIGCRFCMAACPYNAKYFNWHSYQKEAPGQNPDVSLREKGVVEKCTFCHHRLQKARERALAEKREFDPVGIRSRLCRSMSRQGDRLRRSRRSGQRSGATGAQPAGFQTARRVGHQAQSDLSDGG